MENAAAMIDEVPDTEVTTLAAYDEIIDVRSPAEFAEDHLPAAVNLPVLSDSERAEVGTIYKQQSKFLARRIGASHIARNVAHHLETALSEKPASYRPLLYCWRGGMRSGAMATILSQVGWRTGVLKGGYKTWRRCVVESLRDSDAPINIILLDGQTGTAKSEILGRLRVLGVQTLDLEALAVHRGSVFGAIGAKPQPCQKFFESQLWNALRAFDRSRPILVEAESNRIGRCEVPHRLWQSMLTAPHIVVHSDAKTRADYLVHAYADIAQDNAVINTAIDRLAPFQSNEQLAIWRDLAGAKEFAALAASLMRDHYDPLYDRSRARRADKTLAEFSLDNLDSPGIEATAEKIREVVEPQAHQASPHIVPATA